MNDTTRPENMEDVLRRVKKLLAIAEDARADANEAAAAARMAESIMRKYQIEHAEVISAELQRNADESFGQSDVGVTMNPNAEGVRSACGWAGWLGVRVAELNGAQARYAWHPTLGKVLRFQGYAPDVQVCKFTFEFIVNAMVQASNAFLRENCTTRAGAESFRRGFIHACCASLIRAKKERDAEMSAASSSRALVIVKENAVAEHFGKVKYGKSGRRSAVGGQADCFVEGYTQGRRVDVTRRAVGTTSNSTARIAA